jgi:hypothetical protein
MLYSQQFVRKPSEFRMRFTPDRQDDWSLYPYRVQFLRAVERSPKASRIWCELAARLRANGLDRHTQVEEWAIEYRLATAPAGDSWIVRTALEWLRRIESDPYLELPFVDDDVNESHVWECIPHWRRFSECTPPLFAKTDDVSGFRDFEPRSTPEGEGKTGRRRDEFRQAFTDRVHSKLTVEKSLNERDFKWLVKYHFAGTPLHDLPETTGDTMSDESVKQVLAHLRSILQLPARGNAGRPKKHAVRTATGPA